jgi:sec-independent protein translocase protein TatC
MGKEKKEEEKHFKTMSLGAHLEELRARVILALLGLLVGVIICLFFGPHLMRFIAQPYEMAMRKAGQEPVLLAIRPPETFMVYLKTCLLFGLLVSCPWVFYQIWAFVSAGLYQQEKKYVRIISPVSAALFVSGAIFFIKVVAPITMLFFIRFNPGVAFVKSYFTLQNYVNFILALALVFGATFQMPIVIVCLEKLGIISIKALTKSRKLVILAILTIAGVATPGPDVISQIALAVPLYALFEGSVIVCRITRKSPECGSG